MTKLVKGARYSVSGINGVFLRNGCPEGNVWFKPDYGFQVSVYDYQLEPPQKEKNVVWINGVKYHLIKSTNQEPVN